MFDNSEIYFEKNHKLIILIILLILFNVFMVFEWIDASDRMRAISDRWYNTEKKVNELHELSGRMNVKEDAKRVW